MRKCFVPFLAAAALVTGCAQDTWRYPLPPTAMPMAHERPPGPVAVIGDRQSLRRTLATNSKYILLAEVHDDISNRLAVASIMSDLKASRVTVLSVEFGSFMTPVFATLRERLRLEDVSIDDINKTLLTEWQKRNKFPHPGQEEAFKGFSYIIQAAARENIRVIGTDARDDDPAFRQKSWAVESNLYSTADADAYFSFYLSYDKKTVEKFDQEMKKEPPGSRLAVLEGGAHILLGCIDAAAAQGTCTRTLVENMLDRGNVTIISLGRDAQDKEIGDVVHTLLTMTHYRKPIKPDAKLLSTNFAFPR